MMGRVFAVVGPSGAGKDTLLAGVCGAGGPYWVRRVITRPASLGGEPYEGVSEAEFARREAAGAFALLWHTHGLAYAIPKAELDIRRTGRDVVFNGSRAALGLALSRIPDLIVIHVTAPASVLAERLAARGREEAHDIDARLLRDAGPWPQAVPVMEICNDSSPQAGIDRLRAMFQRAP